MEVRVKATNSNMMNGKMTNCMMPASETVSQSICGTAIERDKIQSLKIVTGGKREIGDERSVSKLHVDWL